MAIGQGTVTAKIIADMNAQRNQNDGWAGAMVKLLNGYSEGNDMRLQQDAAAAKSAEEKNRWWQEFALSQKKQEDLMARHNDTFGLDSQKFGWDQQKFGQEHDLEEKKFGETVRNNDLTNQRGLLKAQREQAQSMPFTFDELGMIKDEKVRRFVSELPTKELQEAYYKKDLQQQAISNNPINNTMLNQLHRTRDEYEKMPQSPERDRKIQEVNENIANYNRNAAALQNQAYSQGIGKGQAELETKPQITRMNEQSKADVQLAMGPQIKGAETYAQETTKSKAASEKDFKDFKILSDYSNKNMDNIISTIDNSPELVDPYANSKTILGRLTSGNIGFSNEQLEKRGRILRQIGNVKNDLIAQARSMGQTGINTISEIEQAVIGINENSSAPELKEALKVLKEKNAFLLNAKYNSVYGGYEYQQQPSYQPQSNQSNSGFVDFSQYFGG